jgi:hypothetical protein
VLVCKHDYVPKTQRKFLDQVQTRYPRKNWSSLMIFNNARCRALSPDYVSSAPGLELHRFAWIDDAAIGELPLEWTWLVGEYPYNPGAKIVHFTIGGPTLRLPGVTTPAMSPSSNRCAMRTFKAPPLRTTAAGWTSDLASVRYRATLPAQAIPGSKVTYVGPGANRRTLERLPERRRCSADLLAHNEPSGKLGQNIADYSDDHSHRARPATALGNADAIVAARRASAEVIRRRRRG